MAGARKAFNLAANRSPSPPLAELVRRRAGLLAEEAGEVGRIGEGEIVGDLVDRLAGEYELALGLGEHALADQVPAVTPVARLTWSLSRSTVIASLSA